MTARYRHADLIDCAAALFRAAGLEAPIAGTVAEILVEADLLGYDTHGLQFVPAYLTAIEAGRMATAGAPEPVKDSGAALVLDGRSLPGQWAMVCALEMALERVAAHPTVSVALRHSQNISCLATYAKRAAERGLMAIIAASAPTNAAVAPHGGRQPLYSTNPIAIGIPTDGTPILIDTSTSATTNRRLERTRRAGQRLAQPWLIDAEGRPSDDPAALDADPPGAILPAGGIEQGHKGFALAILVEALTSGLAGTGRADAAPAAGNNVFLQLIDPAAFGGAAAFRRETGHFAALCRASAAIDDEAPVRMPGDRAFALHAEQMAQGVALHPEILPRIAPWLEKYGIAAPEPAQSSSARS